jgi:phage major head subunit gpT-like protein
MIGENWADLLEPGIREWTFVGMSRRPGLRTQMFDVMSSAKASEHFETVGAVTPDAWEAYEKTRLVPAVSFDRGYKTTFTHKEFVLELPILRKLIEDSQYANVMDAAMQLGNSFALKTEYDAASVFNNAFSSSYTGGDGVALCSDAHPNSPFVSSTQDNNGTLALSAANVETTRLAMMAYKDDRGNLVGVTPDTLLVPPALEKTVLEIMGSQLDPSTANNIMNV